METTTKPMTEISIPAAWLAIATSAIALLALASLHILSPEFDPSFHMVSEYANGHAPAIRIAGVGDGGDLLKQIKAASPDGWVLSLMFAAWGVSS